jgi:hypothetical protein
MGHLWGILLFTGSSAGVCWPASIAENKVPGQETRHLNGFDSPVAMPVACAYLGLTIEQLWNRVTRCRKLGTCLYETSG